MPITDDEMSPETQNFRAAQQAKWDSFVAARQAYIDQGSKYSNDIGKVITAANLSIRPSTRVFLFDTFTRVPPGELADLLRALPPTWGDTTEELLGGTQVPAMIKRSFPHRQQAQNLDEVTLAVAADDASWSKALGDLASTTGTVLSSVAGGVGTVARILAWLPAVAVGTAGVVAAVVGVAYVRRNGTV